MSASGDGRYKATDWKYKMLYQIHSYDNINIGRALVWFMFVSCLLG